MKNKTLIRFVESFILLPVMSMSGSVAPAMETPSTVVTTPVVVSAPKLNIEAYGALALNQVLPPKTSADDSEKAQAEMLEAKGKAIDTYFKVKNMPLEGYGKKMALEAEKNGLDWRLIAAISVRESTGGRHDCIRVPNNAFGWGSCKIGFKSVDEAIETVARNLGGNNPKTAHHYDDKTTYQILQTYNPPSIVLKYAEQVITIMNNIGDKDLSVTLAKA